MAQDSNTLVRLYYGVRLIRRVEEEIARIYPSDAIKSPVHLSIGQEAVAVGVCDALDPDDVVSGTYRGHAAYLAKGGGLDRMFAELYGKVTGCARGKGGSMHLVAMDRNFLGTSAVVGTTIPIAVGYALALKREGKGRAVACFLGDGATEEGVFYESLNFAALHRLPVLFVCENNGLAIHTATERRWAAADLCRRVEGFGVPAQRLGMDTLALRATAADCLVPIRQGEGPRFLEVKTYRWREHVGPGEDYDAGYRARSDLESWQAEDQMEALARMIEPAERRRCDDEIEARTRAAVEFAEASPWPEREELDAHVVAV